MVPYSLNTIVVGAACVAASWGLRPTDLDLNMMYVTLSTHTHVNICQTSNVPPLYSNRPLFHIGGIARNLFAVVLSGGGVVCATGFDPSLFWDIVADAGITW